MKKMLFRKFFNRKIQTIGIIALVALWMFVSAFSLNLYITNLNFQKNYFADTNVEDFNFIPKDFDDVDRVADEYQFVYEKQIINDFEEDSKLYRMVSETEKIDIPYIVDGKKIEKDNEILINKEYAEKNNIFSGDKITINEKEYTVSGIATMVNYIRMHIRDDAFHYDSGKDALIIAREDVVTGIQGGKLTASYLGKYKENVSEKEKDSISGEIIRSKDFITVTFQNDNSSITVYDGKISIYFLLTVISLCIMSVIIVLLLIMFLYILINEDRKTIGILIANGMKKKKIFGEYLGAILALLLPSGIIGYLIGYSCSPVLNNLLEADISLPAIEFKFDLLFFGIFMGIVVWVALLSTLCGISGILCKGVIELVKNNKVKKISKFEKFIKKLSRTKKIEKKIRLSFAIRSKLLLVLVLFSVFAAGVEFFLSYSIYKLPVLMKEVQETSMNFENVVYFNEIDKKVTDNDQYFYQLNGVGTNGEKESIVQVCAIEPGELLNLGGVEITKNHAVLNKTTADILKANVGDVITIEIYDKNIEVTVEAICDRIVGKEIFVDYENMVETGMIEQNYSGMYTNSKDITKNDYDNIQTVISKDELLENYEGSQEVMKYGSIILGILGIVIPVILIAITVSILISENQSEIAILKANGITNKVMDKLVYSAYNSFLFIGLLISIPYSFVILNIIFSIAVKSSGIKYPIQLDILGVAFAVAMTVIIYFGTMLILKLKNRTAMESITYDFERL